MMDMRKRRDMQLLYITDEAIMAEQSVCRKKLQKLNFMDRSDFDGIAETVKDLFGKAGKECVVNPPFYCDYGSHIEVGENFFANYNCTIIDVAGVSIGDNCFMAPNVAVYTAGNPCRVIRKITEVDRRKMFHDEEVDDEAWNVICAQVRKSENNNE